MHHKVRLNHLEADGKASRPGRTHHPRSPTATGTSYCVLASRALRPHESQLAPCTLSPPSPASSSAHITPGKLWRVRTDPAGQRGNRGCSCPGPQDCGGDDAHLSHCTRVPVPRGGGPGPREACTAAWGCDAALTAVTSVCLKAFFFSSGGGQCARTCTYQSSCHPKESQTRDWPSERLLPPDQGRHTAHPPPDPEGRTMGSGQDRPDTPPGTAGPVFYNVWPTGGSDDGAVQGSVWSSPAHVLWPLTLYHLAGRTARHQHVSLTLHSGIF